MLLLTGATGLLGGHVLHALLQKFGRVAALRRPSSKTDTLDEIFACYTRDPGQLMQQIDWRQGDMLDQESLFQALDGICCVINCAAIVSFNPRDRSHMIKNNVDGMRNLAEAMRRQEEVRQNTAGGDRRNEEMNTGIPGDDVRSAGCLTRDRRMVLIQVSSIAALGDGPGDDTGFLINEDTLRNTKRRHSGYSVSKYESEKVLREMGLNAVVLNPGVILGPGQWEKGSSQLFLRAWQGLKFYPYGGTGYVDVRDVADIITLITDQLSVIGYRLSVISYPLSVIRYQVSGMGDKGSDIGDQEPRTSEFCHPSALLGERFCLVGSNLRYRDFFNRVTDEFGKPNPHIFADHFLSGLAWRADSLRSRLTGRNPLLTRETAQAAQRISFYSSQKIQKALRFEFRPVEETIEWVADSFRKTKIP